MKKKLLFPLVLVLSLTALAFTWSKREDAPTGYQPGDKATDFKLKNINDQYYSLADNKTAKGFIVIFTCNHCPYAVAYEDRIIALNNKYATQGYPVVAINPNDATAFPDDSFAKMKVRAKEKGFTFPYLNDETQEVAKAYGALRTPHVYILQKQGTDYVVRYVGAIDDNSQDASAVKEKYVEKALDELLVGKPVTTGTTKAIGCGIKWKK